MSEFCGFGVSDSKEFGRFIIAKRNYQRGELILQEEPLLTAQFGKQALSSSSHNVSGEINNFNYACISCFKTLTSGYNAVCPECLWPVCSKGCVLDSLHAKYECSLFKERKIGHSAKVYSHIYLIRGVLMYEDKINPTPWERLASLSSSYSMNQDDYLTSRAEKVEMARQFFKQYFQMDVETKILDHIIGVCNLNGFDMSAEDEPGNSYDVQGVYYFGSMFAHSCAPNAIWVVLPYDYNGVKRGHLRVYTQRSIICNESINISYMGDCFALDMTARRAHLKNHYRFDCKCSRCLDSSEFFFYTEAILCPSCGDDSLTTDDHRDESSTWTCNHCGVCKDYRFAKTCVENFDPWFIWNELSQTVHLPLTPSEKTCGLNQNHRKIIRAAFSCIEFRCRQQFQELIQHSIECEDMFVRFINTTIKCLKVFRMFGSMVNIVKLEYWFARIVAAFYFKTVDFLSTPYDPYLPNEKLAILNAICVHLKIAYNTMEWFPFNFMPLLFRQGLIDGYKFWKDELKGLKHLSNVDLSEPSYEKNEDGVKVKAKVSKLVTKNSDDTSDSESKSSPYEFSHPVTKEPREESQLSTETVEMEKVAASQSSDQLPDYLFTLPGDSKITPTKPPVALLLKFDFHFDT